MTTRHAAERVGTGSFPPAIALGIELGAEAVLVGGYRYVLAGPIVVTVIRIKHRRPCKPSRATRQRQEAT